MSKKKSPTSREQRNLRIQQAIFGLIGIIVILSMLIALVAK